MACGGSDSARIARVTLHTALRDARAPNPAVWSLSQEREREREFSFFLSLSHAGGRRREACSEAWCAALLLDEQTPARGVLAASAEGADGAAKFAPARMPQKERGTSLQAREQARALTGTYRVVPRD